MDAAFDGVLQSSLFDYSTLTEEGLVTNRLYTLSPSVGAEPQCDELPVVPTFPLFLPEVLVTNEAVYAGTDVDHFNGVVTKVRLSGLSSTPPLNSDTRAEPDFLRSGSSSSLPQFP